MASPIDQSLSARIAESFARQKFMQTLGATLAEVAPGVVRIALPFSPALTQQHGSLHAAAVTAIADSACGYAALTLMPPGSAVVSVEFKVNLLAPAVGDRFLAVGTVVRAGRTLVVTQGEVHAEAQGRSTPVLLMQATMMRLEATPDRQG